MPKTRNEMIDRALRELSVLSAEDQPTADDEAYVGGTYDALIAELAFSHGVTISDSDAVPDKLFIPLGAVLASDVAPHYMAPTPRRSVAIGRLREAYYTDDREDRRDIDGDGIVTDGEADADARAAYY